MRGSKTIPPETKRAMILDPTHPSEAKSEIERPIKDALTEARADVARLERALTALQTPPKRRGKGA